MSFELTEQERHSPLAMRLVAHLNERLDDLRRSNDFPIPPEQTAALRGKIVGVKHMLDLLAPPAAKD